MNYFILVIVTAWMLSRGHALGAAFVWCAVVSIIHAIQEAKGRLWFYFAEVTGAGWLRGLAGFGFWLIVAPALLLQLVASLGAFMGHAIDARWLALLIGARIGDAAFSHLIPFARGYKLSDADIVYPDAYNPPPVRTPGLQSAFVYLIDGLILFSIWREQLTASRSLALWFAIGAGFFASVQPTLRLLRNRD